MSSRSFVPSVATDVGSSERRSALSTAPGEQSSSTESELRLRDIVDELRGTLGRTELALGLVSDAIVWTGGDARVHWCNSSFDALIGKPHIEILGASFLELLPLELNGQPLAPEAHPASLGLSASLASCEIFGFDQGQTKLLLEVSCRRAEMAAGDVVMVFDIRDVTRRIQAEQALRKAKDQAETANRELEAFSYSASHDLNAPLRSIDGFARLLLEDCLDKLNAEDQDFLLRIRKSAQHMANIIDGLLHLSQVVHIETSTEEADLSAMARAAAARLQGQQPERRIELVIQEGLKVQGDPPLLGLVLQNLIGNAWKFTSKVPNPRIEFGLCEQAGEGVYFVRDNGAGFDMAHAGRLFTAFQRLHTLAEYPGSGIGLATVQRIIRRHGGRIWALGSVGGGATLFFTIASPAAAAQPP